MQNLFTSFSIKKILIYLSIAVIVVVVAAYFTTYSLPFSETKSIEVIHIVPIGISKQPAVQLQQLLGKEFPGISTVLEDTITISEAEYAFDEIRGQYNAEVLLDRLRNLPFAKNQNVIAITSLPLFTPGLNFVFSSVKDNVGIFSIALLYYTVEGKQVTPNADETLAQERIRKIVMRMVGAMAGLRPRFFGDYNCVMRFSNSLEDLDAKGTDWCGDEQEKILQAQNLSQ